MAKIEVKAVNTGVTACDLVDFIAAQCTLSKAAIKRGLTFGGGWIKPVGQSSLKRCRKAKYSLKPGDACEFYYDENLIAQRWEAPLPVYEQQQFGIWYKPRHQVTQGSRYGDANALERHISDFKQQPIWLVHRLDSAACGLVMFAYSAQACAKLSQLMQAREIVKTYQAQLEGSVDAQGVIEQPLDGQDALTEFNRVTQDDHTSWVSIRLHTGRYHQIRRHFAAIGHPLVGDPRYGAGKSNAAGLQLVASQLEFCEPFFQVPLRITLPHEYCLF